MLFWPLFCGSWATDVDKSPKDSVSKEHSVFSALEIEASLCKHAVPCLWLLLEETLALHCTIPARHQVHERQTTGSAGILCPLRYRDHWEFCVGDKSFGASGWKPRLYLLQSWACVHGCMFRVIQLLPLVSLQKKGTCRSASCDQGCQKASPDEAGRVDALHLFITLLARIKQHVCNQSAHTHSSHFTRVLAWLCSKTFLETPGSERLGAGEVQLLWLPHLPVSWYCSCPVLPVLQSFALCQGDYSLFPLCPSFNFFPYHVRHDKEMRNHSLCYASAMSFMLGHCTSNGTQ